MIHEFVLADIGEGLEEAEIIQWLVAPGDQVARDQPIVEVMTDKSNAELPAPVSGTVVSLGADVGQLVVVGALLATIDDTPDRGGAPPNPDGAAPRSHDTGGSGFFQEVTASTAVSSSSDAEAAARPSSVPSPLHPRAGGRVKASPATRREAARRGIDLATLHGSGPGDRILMSDLDAIGSDAGTGPAVATVPSAHTTTTLDQRHAQGTDPLPPGPGAGSGRDHASAPSPESATAPLRGIRRVVANNMHRSWSTIPHIHSFQEIDAEPLITLRSQLRGSGRAEFADITPLSLLVAAVAHAMSRHREANATLDLDEATIITHPTVNVGIAVATERGLLVPVLTHADGRDLGSIATEVARLVDGARQGTLASDDFSGGTVTVTNFGSLGGEQATPIIRPGESVIFGFGAIAARPWVVDGSVVPQATMHTVIGVDHRLLDGDVATSLLATANEALTNPINLVLGG